MRQTIWEPVKVQTKMETSHLCSLRSEQRSWEELSGIVSIGKFRRTLLGVLVISKNNPLTIKYFKSEASIREEKRRQIFSKFPFVIHPFSKFRMWYEIYISIIYLFVLIVKPMDIAIVRRSKMPFPKYDIMLVALDILCILDIFINFFTGFVRKKSRLMEIRFSETVKHYLKSPYFFCDVVSSISGNSPWITPLVKINIGKQSSIKIVGAANILKLARLVSLLQSIPNISQYSSNRLIGNVLYLQVIIGTILLIHWISLVQMLIPRLVQSWIREAGSWVYRKDIYYTSFFRKFAHCIFNGASTFMGVTTHFYITYIHIDSALSVFILNAGRLIRTFIWVILALAILNSRSVKIKYQEILVEVEDYLEAKRIPLKLRERINSLYKFIYGKGYCRQKNILDLLSTNLRNEMQMFEHQKMIQSVTILSKLPAELIKTVVGKLKSNIYMPNETILQYGTTGNNIYFIASGTVAVYTHSGKEVCHLQDGDYFGESFLVTRGNKMNCTIIAIEICQIYELGRRRFQKLFSTYPKVYETIISEAEKKAQKIIKIELAYKSKRI
ncbi:hypothetical protein JTB14_003963 [Gonioctena quinquepunctata]|nr:hypothetical protein JTB14_003963 [Gonioctena quinquepunctata]